MSSQDLSESSLAPGVKGSSVVLGRGDSHSLVSGSRKPQSDSVSSLQKEQVSVKRDTTASIACVTHGEEWALEVILLQHMMFSGSTREWWRKIISTDQVLVVTSGTDHCDAVLGRLLICSRCCGATKAGRGAGVNCWAFIVK